MTVAYNWSVAQMDAYPTYENYTDVVFTVHWRLDGTDGEHTADVYGSVGLTLDPDAPFTPYADLTEAQVIGWVQDALGEEQVASYEASVTAQVAALANPPVVTPPLPWNE
jgi:hypothetical protein